MKFSFSTFMFSVSFSDNQREQWLYYNRKQREIRNLLNMSIQPFVLWQNVDLF